MCQSAIGKQVVFHGDSQVNAKPSLHERLEDADRRGGLIPFLLLLDKGIRNREVAPALSELNNSGKVSLTSEHNLNALQSLDRNEFWSVVHIFNQMIPELDCSFGDVLRLVHTLVCKAGNDGAAGKPNISLVKWCKANPDKAQLIVEGAMSLDQLCLSHCVFAIQGLGNIELAFELVGHSDKVVVAAGLRSLGMLDLGSEESARRAVDQCCQAISNENDRDVRASAIEAAFCAWERSSSLGSYRQQEFVGAIVNANVGGELVQLVANLLSHPKGVSAESIDIILEALTGDISNPQASLHWLDAALHSKDIDWSLTRIIDIFTAQIPKLEGSIGPIQLANFCQWIWDDPENAAQLFSKWLISGQLELCRFLAGMVDECGEKSMVVELSRANLPNDLNDQVFLARKCVGFLCHNPVTAVSILLSIVKHGKMMARDEAEELIYDPLLLCYSVSLRSFLGEQGKNPSKRISSCIERLLKRHDDYLEGLKKAEHLVELRPTIEQRRAAAIKDREFNKDIQKQAYERSVLVYSTSHKTLLYGRQSFFLVHGDDGSKVPKVMPLSESTFGAELPRLHILNPVGFREMTTLLRIEPKIMQ